MDISKIIALESINSASRRPMYKQIVETIISNIENGTISPGSKLPPERELAGVLGVSRTTAINAYRELEKQGLVITRIGSGTYVAEPCEETAGLLTQVPWNQLFAPYTQTRTSAILRELVSTPLCAYNISLATGMPDPELYPLAEFKELSRQYFKLLRKEDMGHIPTEGYEPLRAAVKAMMADKGVDARLDEVMVLAGSQQGIYLVSKVFIQPGDYVMIEAPSYIGAIQIFNNAGARVLTVPSDGRLPLGLIEDYLVRYRPKLFYTIPTHNNPNSRVMSVNERQELLKLAAKYQLIIIEDDAYGDLSYENKPPASLKAMSAYQGIIYISTFSKVLFPGLRTGWMVAPSPVILRMALEKQYIDLHGNNLTQWLLSQYLLQGSIAGHINKIRQEYKKRRDTLMSGIRRYCGNGMEFNVPAGGFYLWCKLTGMYTAQQLLHETTQNGVSFVPGEAFYLGGEGKNELRLCFVTHSEKEIEEGARRLGQSLKELEGRRQFSTVKHGHATQPII